MTAGIVNVPLNTPAYLLFVCKSPREAERASEIFKYHDIPSRSSVRKKNTVVESMVVLDHEKIKAVQLSNTEGIKMKRRTLDRYLFFELDTLDPSDFFKVIAVYKRERLPVYYHRTLRGWHFLSVKPIPVERHNALLAELKPLNTSCPHVTLRIRSNKWIGEGEVWSGSGIEAPALHSDTLRLREMVEKQDIKKLAGKYFIVYYDLRKAEGASDPNE